MTVAMRRTVVTLVLVQLLLVAASIPGHSVHIDEAWIGEQAWMLNRDGYVRSDLFEGYSRSDERIVVYHRLFVSAGAIAVRLLGWGVGPLRLVSILSTTLLLGLMIWFLRRERQWSLPELLLPLLLILLVPLVFDHLKTYRPELMMSAFGFLGYILLERGWRRNSRITIALAGAASTLAPLAHPYGVIFPVASAFMLVGKRRWLDLLVLTGGGLAMVIPSLVDILHHAELFGEQISNNIVAKKTAFTISTPLVNLLGEHKRLFRTPETIVVVGLYLCALVDRWKSSGTGDREFRIYTLLLVALLGVIAPEKITRSLIPLLPFMVIEIAASIRDVSNRSKPLGYLTIAARVILVAGIFGGIVASSAKNLRPRVDIAAFNSTTGSHLPPGTAVVAPMNVVFNQIESRRIVSLFRAALETDGVLDPGNLARFARQHHAGAIIFNRYQIDEGFARESAGISELARRYRVLDDTTAGWTIVFLDSTQTGAVPGDAEQEQERQLQQHP